MTHWVVFVQMKMNIKIVIQMAAQVTYNPESCKSNNAVWINNFPSTQLTALGAHGVHGKPAPQRVVMALKKETGQ